MNFLKRAILSVRHHKVKNIILIIAFALISTMLFCSISIYSAAKAVQKNTMQKFDTQVKIEYSHAKMKNHNYDNIPAKLLTKLKSLKHIKTYNYVTYYLAFCKGIKPPVEKGSAFNIACTTDSSVMNEFSSNTYRLVAGRPIKKSDEGTHAAIVSKALAEKNHLHLGDTITLLGLIDKNVEIKFKIIGIFEVPGIIKTADNNIEFSGSKIFADFDSAAPVYNHAGYKQDPAEVTAACYSLDSPTNVISFIKAAKKIPGMENYAVTADTSLYDRLTLSLRMTDTFTFLMTAIILIAGCIIFALIIALLQRGRRRECGILLAIGEKKFFIAAQLFVETVIPILIAFCIGIFASTFVSQKICDRIVSLNNTSISNQDNTNWNDMNYVLGSNSSKHVAIGEFISDTAVPIKTLNAQVTPSCIAVFVGCGILIALISMLLPTIRILGLNPRTILEKKE